jgi:hypothetical protein
MAAARDRHRRPPAAKDRRLELRDAAFIMETPAADRENILLRARAGKEIPRPSIGGRRS